MAELINVAAPAAVPMQTDRDPAQLSGQMNALFERHLRFDNVVDPPAAETRQKFEAAARAVRDVLSQRWIETQQWRRLTAIPPFFLSDHPTVSLPAIAA